MSRPQFERRVLPDADLAGQLDTLLDQRARTHACAVLADAAIDDFTRDDLNLRARYWRTRATDTYRALHADLADTSTRRAARPEAVHLALVEGRIGVQVTGRATHGPHTVILRCTPRQAVTTAAAMIAAALRAMTRGNRR